MDIPISAPVMCSDGPGGHVIAFVVQLLHNQITHIVVRDSGLFAAEHMVAVAFITATAPDQVLLHCTQETLAHQPSFIAYEFIPSLPAVASPPADALLLWPYVNAADAEAMPTGHENIPKGETALHHGAQVHAADGVAGHVSALRVGAAGSITHIVLRAGHLGARHAISIPVAQLDHLAEDAVYVKLTKSAIAALPTPKLHHSADQPR